MVGRFAGLRGPFLRVLAKGVHGLLEAVNVDLCNLGNVADFLSQLERGIDGALGMVFRRPEFDVSLREHEIRWAAAFRPHRCYRELSSQDELHQAEFAFEDW